MKMEKRLLGLLAIVVSLVIPGCKSSNKNEIKFQFLKAGMGLEVYENLAKAYEAEHPGVKVKLIPNYDVNADVDKHLSSGRCSDIYSVRDITKLKRFFISGDIVSLNDVYDSEIVDGQKLIDLIEPAAADYCEYNGNYICVPEYMNVNGFVYNKKLFDEKGWTVPTTTEEMTALAEKIKADTGDTIKAFVTCAPADGYFYYLLNGISDAYEGLTNLENIYKFDTPEIWNPVNREGKRYGMQTMRDWYTDPEDGKGYVLHGSIGQTHTVSQEQLVKNKAAMMLNGSWFESEMKSYLDPAIDEMAMFKIPEYSEGGVVLHNEGYDTKDGKGIIGCEFPASFIIPSKAKNIEGAKDFLKFISRPDICELFTKSCNSVRPFKYNKDSSSEVYKDMTTFGKSVLDIANNNNPFIEYSKSQLTISAELMFWPLEDDRYHIKAMLQNGTSIDTRLQAEYDKVKTIDFTKQQSINSVISNVAMLVRDI